MPHARGLMSKGAMAFLAFSAIMIVLLDSTVTASPMASPQSSPATSSSNPESPALSITYQILTDAPLPISTSGENRLNLIRESFVLTGLPVINTKRLTTSIEAILVKPCQIGRAQATQFLGLMPAIGLIETFDDIDNCGANVPTLQAYFVSQAITGRFVNRTLPVVSLAEDDFSNFQEYLSGSVNEFLQKSVASSIPIVRVESGTGRPATTIPANSSSSPNATLQVDWKWGVRHTRCRLFGFTASRFLGSSAKNQGATT
ncbi:hypothetical protein BC829DRAFT_121851 [Chytridium lagenaria]|nr:hypothetical protein BC829DRAFT_121851 [Chytridium lagenaria]